MTRRKTVDIDRVLDATEAVIMEVGHHRLTLNLVAEKAGISRGGLAYSFPSKDDLLRAATQREMRRFTAELARLREAAGPGHAAILARIAVTRCEDEKMIGGQKRHFSGVTTGTGQVLQSAAGSTFDVLVIVQQPVAGIFRMFRKSDDQQAGSICVDGHRKRCELDL